MDAKPMTGAYLGRMSARASGAEHAFVQFLGILERDYPGVANDMSLRTLAEIVSDDFAACRKLFAEFMEETELPAPANDPSFSLTDNEYFDDYDFSKTPVDVPRRVVPAVHPRRINGRDYDDYDPTSTENMPEEGWSVVSEASPAEQAVQDEVKGWKVSAMFDRREVRGQE